MSLFDPFGDDRPRRRKPATEAELQPYGDGLIKPDGYPQDKWDRMSDQSKTAVLSLHASQLRVSEKRNAPKRNRAGVTNYTTKAAIQWGRAQGWKLVDREQYDARLKRHHDCLLGMDAIMELPSRRLVGVQGAGSGERKQHWDRFMERGGTETATIRNMMIVYVEFVRGSDEPVLIEEWVS